LDKRTIKKKDTLIVGLTGQTGAGKTTVSDLFIYNEFYVINADMISRMVTMKGMPCLDEISKVFGSNILDDDGRSNTKKVR